MKTSTFLFSKNIFKLYLVSWIVFVSCSSSSDKSTWDLQVGEDLFGVMKITQSGSEAQVSFTVPDFGTVELQNVKLDGQNLSAEFSKWGEDFTVMGTIDGDNYSGVIQIEDEKIPMIASRQSEELVVIDRSHVSYILDESDLPESEMDIDHAGLIGDFDGETVARGARIYNGNCINCHGNPDIPGSIPLSQKFWSQKFKAGNDPFSMYQTITRGMGSMPPQVTMTPREKYDVIQYIRQNFVRDNPNEAYVAATPGYLKGLPEGDSMGPEAKDYNPWSDMDYGTFFINTYELVDEETGPERFHSPGPVPFVDEDYLENNFAYKGIAVRLDQGLGGVSDGRAWMIFDHDVMRVAGGWTGEGFIDWDGILLNDNHETYPRTVGKLHFETPVGPGWANPVNGTWDDPRFTARDGRQFGPLPKSWSDYKGLYHHGDRVIISYSVGNSSVLEMMGMKEINSEIVFTRNLNVQGSSSILKTRISSETANVKLIGSGGELSIEDGFHVLTIPKNTDASMIIAISSNNSNLDLGNMEPEDLSLYTKGGEMHYPEVVTSQITPGVDDGPFRIDLLTPPFENPWDSRMKLSGIDFLEDPDQAVICATDGDVWLVSGLINGGNQLKWRRIASGLFQPLGIKVIDENIYVTCRDQLVVLRDLNGDGETDFYESFNHDHQVTDHFHEFAMGLQSDKAGNLYYAKSGRHAREALIPQHGTLIKVSSDGSESEIVATGFRAANGVCINPDGTFIVTDQQGFWNPMNRINWVNPDGSFYGNMWGYNPPDDTSRAGMEPPMVWVDMEFDRSPSELLWVESEKWGPLNGSLLSFSYGYGKIQLVLNETVNGQRQGGVIDLPNVKFLTGVMRGRFNPGDGDMYACGMSAWGTSQMMRGGGLYRVSYTGKPLTLPVELSANTLGIELSFAQNIDAGSIEDLSNFKIETWDLKRSAEYGSERYNRETKTVSDVQLARDGSTVILMVEGIEPVDVMTITYDILDVAGNKLEGTVQNTIHNLKSKPNS